MELNWMAGDEDVKCFADKDEDGARKGRVLVGSGKDAQRVERFLGCDGVFPTEEEAVITATASALARMPAQAEMQAAGGRSKRWQILASRPLKSGACSAVSNARIGPAPTERAPMNSQARVDRVKDLYRLNVGMFPAHMESTVREYCDSYGSAPMAYVRLMAEQEFRGLLAYVNRQPRFADLDERDCELIERLFREGTNQTALMEALDERRAEWNRGEPSERLCTT